MTSILVHTNKCGYIPSNRCAVKIKKKLNYELYCNLLSIINCLASSHIIICETMSIYVLLSTNS